MARGQAGVDKDEMLRLAKLADLMSSAPIDERCRFHTSYSRQMDGAERQLERLTALLGFDDDDRRVA
jgi:hypothetical protein